MVDLELFCGRAQFGQHVEFISFYGVKNFNILTLKQSVFNSVKCSRACTAKHKTS